MNYEEKCLALDKELAELLGWAATPYHDRDDPNKPMYKVPGNLVYQVPCWTLDDAEAFRLMVEHNIELDILDTFISYFLSGQKYYVEDFPSKIAAVRYAIVQATINKLSQSDNSDK